MISEATTDLGAGNATALVVAPAESLTGIGPEGAHHPMAMAGKLGLEDSVRNVAQKEQWESEIASLVKFFNEEEGLHAVPRYRKDKTSPSNVQRKKIATFLEGSRLPFSALVKDIFEKLSGENDQDQSKSGAITMAFVKSNILSLGERRNFGITNPDDILEDDSAGSLWCWEIRDVKLLPKPFRDEVVDRSRLRKKIGDRIAAVSGALAALQSTENPTSPGSLREPSHQAEEANLKTQLESLTRVDDEAAIRAVKELWQQKREAGIAATTQPPLGEQPNNLTQESATKRRRSDPEEKLRLQQEKLLKKQQIESEREQKRKEKEEADRKKQQQKQQKQQKQQQDDAEKEQKRKEKEEGERKKQEKKQQDEAEREQKREAERKKQLALKKQVSIMDRFLIKKDSTISQSSPSIQTQQPETQPTSTSPLPPSHNLTSLSQTDEAAVLIARMDSQLTDNSAARESTELLQQHLSSWLSVRYISTTRKPNRWGARRKPKVSVCRELRLNNPPVNDTRRHSLDGTKGAENCQSTKGAESSHLAKGGENSSSASSQKRDREELESPPEDVDWKENAEECLTPNSPFEGRKSLNVSRYQQLRNKRRKLLQFDKSHRPPYYGTFSKRSDHIKPRRPLKQDPGLDYEVDSADEWEEEEPGESLSDVEKDDEDERGEIEEIEEDEDGPDEFVVPDGYLSENEGVAMEDSERGAIPDGRGSSDGHSPVTQANQSVMTLERLRKVLDNATEHAIRSNHPLVISNLGQLSGSGDEDSPSPQFPSNRTETMCLEALRMRVLVPNLLIGAC